MDQPTHIIGTRINMGIFLKLECDRDNWHYQNNKEHLSGNQISFQTYVIKSISDWLEEN